MAAPALIWNRVYVMGNTNPGRFEAPITPIAGTIIPATSGTYGTSSSSSTFSFPIGTSVGAFSGRVEFTANRDLSTHDYILFQSGQNSWPFPDMYQYIDTFANGGLSIVFFDGSGNWADIAFFGNEFTTNLDSDGGWAGFRSPGQFGCFPGVLERGRVPISSSGVLDWSDIAGFEFIVRATGFGDAGSPNLEVGSIMLADAPILTDGEVGNEGGFSDLRDGIRSFDQQYQQLAVFKDTTGNFKGAIAALFEPYYSFTVGCEQFEDSGSTLAMYPIADISESTLPCMLLDGSDRGLTVSSPTSTSSIRFIGSTISAASYTGGQSYVYTRGDTDGEVLYSNCIFNKQSVVEINHADASGSTLIDCERVVITEGSIASTLTYRSSSVSADGIYVNTAPHDYSALGIRFELGKQGNDITIDPVSAGAFDFSGVSVEAGHTLAIRNDSASIDIDVTIPSVPFSTSTAGGAINVLAPVVLANGSTVGLLADSFLLIKNSTAEASPSWASAASYNVGDRVLRSSGTGSEETSGLFFRCSVSGLSGVSEPAWNTSVKGETTDGAVTWVTEAIAPVVGIQSVDLDLDYVDGEEFKAGDSIEYKHARWVNTPSLNYKLPETAGAIASASGFVIAVNQVDWVPVNSIGIDGSIVGEFDFDLGNVQIDIDDPDGITQKTRLVAWYAYEIATNPLAINQFLGALLIEDEANFRIITSIADIYLEAINGKVYFDDPDRRLYRDDGLDLVANSGDGISISSGKVYVATGSGGGGDATEAKQNQILSELGEIQGAGFDTASDSLVQIKDSQSDATLANQAQIISNQTIIDGKLDTKASQSSVDSVPTSEQNADTLLGRNIQGGGSGQRTVTEALRASRNRVDLEDGIVYEEDDTTVSHSYTVTRKELDAISEVDPT